PSGRAGSRRGRGAGSAAARGCRGPARAARPPRRAGRRLSGGARSRTRRCRSWGPRFALARGEAPQAEDGEGALLEVVHLGPPPRPPRAAGPPPPRPGGGGPAPPPGAGPPPGGEGGGKGGGGGGGGPQERCRG